MKGEKGVFGEEEGNHGRQGVEDVRESMTEEESKTVLKQKSDEDGSMKMSWNRSRPVKEEERTKLQKTEGSDRP